MDQFFYPGLQKTEFRDAGQTVSRWTGTNPEPGEKGRKTAIDSSYVIMVDQIWLWIINQGEHFLNFGCCRVRFRPTKAKMNGDRTV